MATPDDLEEFRASHNGFLAAPSAPWNDMSRGATHWIEGPDEDARAIGINPLDQYQWFVADLNIKF